MRAYSRGTVLQAQKAKEEGGQCARRNVRMHEADGCRADYVETCTIGSSLRRELRALLRSPVLRDREVRGG